jgi:hypothetical protein
LESQGNVEGALRWDCKTLAPKETWAVVPVLRFYPSQADHDGDTFSPALTGRGLEFADAPEGRAYKTDSIDDFLLDRLGGFDWEATRRESAIYEGLPNIGQIFWQVECGTTKAGRGAKGGYGLVGSSLPATTLDGRVRIDLKVISADAETIGLAFSIQNASDQAIENVRFSFCINADIGGPDSSSKQKAAYVRTLNGILFSGGEGRPTLLLCGQDAAGCIVSTWPEAHRLVVENQWEPLGSGLRGEAPVASVSDGLQIQLPNGTVAVGARADDDDWAVEAVDLPGDLTSALPSALVNKNS